MIEIREYLDAKGHSPYAKWINGLNAQAAAKVVIAATAQIPKTRFIIDLLRIPSDPPTMDRKYNSVEQL